MEFKKFTTKYISVITIFVIASYVFGTNQGHKFWTFPNKVIEWDVKSYYAYLPATFIYKDLTFNFVSTDENSDYLRTQVWPIKLENGKMIIKTSMGMSYLYLPAFLIANSIAEPLGYKSDGYSKPYKYMITMLAFFYLLLGIYYLRKLLLNLKFSELSIFLTSIAVVSGTNLIYYTSYEPGMTHVYNFTLITIFLYNTSLWWKAKRTKNLIIIGLLGGLIALIRPTNILVFLLFAFWDINSFQELKQRAVYFVSNIKILLTLLILFILPWIPQMIFWKVQTGHLLFFSYGDNERFFFENPQIFNILFSYWKGWYLYTPLMLLATLGLIPLFKSNKNTSLLIIFFMSIIIYILSSWWSWWFGGSYGARSFIDFYGIMSIPLASLFMSVLNKKRIKYSLFIIIPILIFHNNFQIRQYNSGAVNCFSMTKEMYWEQFLKIEKTDHYLEIEKEPDATLAMKGQYKLIKKRSTN